jgi:Protein of unknown function with HXXEE motif
MSLRDILLLCTAAYALHIIEEFALNWRDWANNVLKLPVDWPNFYVVNAIVIVFGALAATIAPTEPGLALSFAAVMLVNATAFHVQPWLTKALRFSPGLITAVVLSYPLGIAAYWRSFVDGLTPAAAFGSLVLGAVLMAFPVVLLKVKDRPYFRQDR